MLSVIQLCRAPFLSMLDICETILHAFIKRTKRLVKTVYIPNALQIPLFSDDHVLGKSPVCLWILLYTSYQLPRCCRSIDILPSQFASGDDCNLFNIRRWKSEEVPRISNKLSSLNKTGHSFLSS